MKLNHTALLLLALLVAQTVAAATITVTNIADSGPGSLRAALASAANGDTIDASGVSDTILLTSGELLVTNSVDILGPGPGNLTVDGNAVSRVFRIGSNTVVSISGLTITNGAFYEDDGAGIHNSAALTVSNCTITGNDTDYGAGGGIYNNLGVLIVNSSTLSSNDAGYGGGIYNAGGTVTISDSAFSGNGAFEGGGMNNGGGTGTVSNCTFSGNGFGAGGGIFNAGVLTVNNSTLLSGVVVEAGGGICNIEGATTDVSNCTVSGNSAGGGGGLYNDGGTLIVESSTLSGNTAGNGGAIDVNSGTLEIANSTLSSNTASSGGAIVNEGDTTINNSTLSGNTAIDFYGGAYYSYAGTLTINNSTLTGNGASYDGGGTYSFTPITINNSIVALNTAPSNSDVAGSLTGSFNFIGGDPLLGPLQDNGGPTLTHALLPGSPAIDQGKNFSASATDQRGIGFARTSDDPAVPNAAGGDGTDIGAFEVQQVVDPAEQINDLIGLVRSFHLKTGTANSLIVKLQAAARALDRGRTWAACGNLRAFLNEVNAQKGKKLTVAQADLLIVDATQIRTALNCP